MAAPLPIYQAQLHGPSGANRLIGGIVSFARWPDGAQDPTDRTFCVVGTPQLATPVAPVVSGKPFARIEYRSGNQPSLMGCDILYVGKMTGGDRLRLIQSVGRQPILTLTDDDPSCSYGAMFCLYRQAQQIGFSVNLDAIKRGNLRIDPRVLRIGREG
jgi:hypothetical protein